MTRKDLVLIVAATTGAALVISSQESQETSGTGPWTTLLGTTLAVLTPTAADTAAFSLIWSKAITTSLPEGTDKQHDPDRIAVSLALMPLLITTVLTTPATGVAALATGEMLRWQTLLTGFATGALTSTGAWVLFLKTTLLTMKHAINSLKYLTQVLALTWLMAASNKYAAVQEYVQYQLPRQTLNHTTSTYRGTR